MKKVDIEKFIRSAKLEIIATLNPDHYILSIHETRGGAELLAYGMDDLWWLKTNSYQVQRVSGRSLYFVRIDG